MASFADFTATLNLNISNFSSALGRAASQVERFSTAVNGGTSTATNNIKDATENTRKWGLNMKSVSQVVSGIIISQAFYKIIQNIRAATQATWEFVSALDYAKISYSNLFGDVELASEFIEVLKDFTAVTPFDFGDTQAAARRLFAYGIEYKNVMYLMQGVMSASAMSGDSVTIERVSRAIGQIYTKGRLMNEEMRQLAEAGIPAYDILIDKLGLTQKQLQNLGDQSIPAATAINALIEGINERFGSVAAASSKTLKGLISNIKDNMLILASDVFEPFTTFLRSLFNTIGEGLYVLRDLMETGGIGKIFEHIVPEEAQHTVRQFLANLYNLWTVLRGLFTSVMQLAGSIISGLVRAFNLLAPAITLALNVLTAIVYSITSNEELLKGLTAVLLACAAAWVVFKLKALGALVIGAVATAISAVSKAINFLSLALIKSPWTLLIAGIAALLIYLAISSDKANNSLSNLFSKLMSFNGKTANDILQPNKDMQKAPDDINKFNEALDDTNDALDETSKKAASAKKGLLAFDEVFKLNETTTDTPTDTTEDIIPGFAGLGEAWVPEVPDLSTFASGFVDEMYSSLMDAIKRVMAGAATGVLVGGLAGFVIGGFATGTLPGALAGAKLGAKIGSVVGAGLGAFWSSMSTDMQQAILNTATGASLGMLVGSLLGFVIGGFAMQDLKGAIAGARLGAAIGAGLGAELGGFWNTLSEDLQKSLVNLATGASIGTLMGGLLGFIIGGFVTQDIKGAITGAKLGTLIGAGIGGALGGFWDDMSSEMQNSIMRLGSGAGVGALIGGLLGFILGALIAGLPGAMAGGKIGAAIGGLIGAVINTFWDDIKIAFENVFAAMGAWFATAWEDIKYFFTVTIPEVFNTVINWVKDNWLGLALLLVNPFVGAIKLLYDNNPAFKAWLDELWASISEWAVNLYESVGAWFTDLVASIGTWFTAANENVTLWWNELWNAEKWAAGWLAVKEWFSKLFTDIDNWFGGLFTDIADWWNDLWDADNWVSGWSAVKDWFDNLFGDIAGWFSSIGSSVSNWWNGLWGDKKVSVSASAAGGTSSYGLSGHAVGGIFDREHIARFAEGNKAEAVIPLENASAMQPFVDAIANGITASLAPILVSSAASETQQPLYVGTLIADERGLKELERKLKVVRVKEERRGN